MLHCTCGGVVVGSNKKLFFRSCIPILVLEKSHALIKISMKFILLLEDYTQVFEIRYF